MVDLVEIAIKAVNALYRYKRNMTATEIHKLEQAMRNLNALEEELTTTKRR